MVVLNYSGDEINAKIVYYGPGLSGKTTNLDYMHRNMPVEGKGKLVSMKTRTDRTLFFDFLPVDFDDVAGYRTRFNVYTVPGQVYYNATRKLVLKGVDAVVFVADSAPDKLAENVESLRNLEENLNELGLSLDSLPWVIQYNKRDLPNAVPVQQLHQQLNLLNVPAFEAVATKGGGVVDTFYAVATLVHGQLQEKVARGEVVGQVADPDVHGMMPPDVVQQMEPAAPPAAPVVETEEDPFDAIDTALREVPGDTPSPPPPPQPRPVAPKPAPVAPPAQASSEAESLGSGAGPSVHVHGDDNDDDSDRNARSQKRPVAPPDRVGPNPALSESNQPVSTPARNWSLDQTGEDDSRDLSDDDDGASLADGMDDRYEIVETSNLDYESAVAEMENAQQPNEPRPHKAAPRPVVPSAAPEPKPKAAPAATAPSATVPDDEPKMFRGEGEGPMDGDFGRTLPIDANDDSVTIEVQQEPEEFITDPMGQHAPPKPEPEPAPTPLPKGEATEVHVPVVISRSQVRKSVPVKLILEISVVDD